MGMDIHIAQEEEKPVEDSRPLGFAIVQASGMPEVRALDGFKMPSVKALFYVLWSIISGIIMGDIGDVGFGVDSERDREASEGNNPE